jgi:chromosome segregation ATPase
LSGIARKEEAKDILVLLEFLVFATINSPYKEEFIRKIMELDEECQTHFMFFIQKALGEGDSPLLDPSIRVENKEVLILRADKQRLAVQIEELLEELKQFKAINLKLTQERDELQLIVTDLKSDASKKARINLADIPDSNEIELRFTEKDVKIMQLSNHLSDLKISSEKEISRLRDELDVANAKAYNLSQAEKTIAQYKKRIDSLATVKSRVQELEKENEDLHDQLELKMIEIDNFAGLKKTLKALKDDLNCEKQNNESLSYKLENLKKEMKKKEAEVDDLKQKVIFAEVRIRDLEKNGFESSLNSDDSPGDSKINELEEAFQQPLEVRRETRRVTMNLELEQYRKEKLLLQHKVNKSKEKSRRLKEQISMMNEELDLKSVNSSKKITQLNYQLQATTSQLQVVSQKVSVAQNDKIKLDQCTYELEQVKIHKENLVNEMKKLYEDKDQTYKKLVESREETKILQSTITLKDAEIRQKEFQEKILHERVQALLEKEKVSVVMVESLKRDKGDDVESVAVKLSKTEKELISLKSEKSELLLRITEKDQQIQEVLKEKTETIIKIEADKKEALSKMKEENNRRMNQIIVQCDEAITELQNEREIVLAQLKIEKKNAIQEWKKPMDSGWSQSSKEEISKLKEEIVKKDREINKLTKNNADIKKCWKDSTRLLKDVWKQIQEETEKIQKATKGYK